MMTVGREEILFAIENSLFEFPIPSQFGQKLDFPGLRGRQILEGTHPFFDLVGASQLSSDTVAAMIDRVHEHFTSQNKTFGWTVGPLSTPNDLAIRLEQKGLQKIVEFAGMVLYDLNTDIRTNPKITVRKATEDDADDIAFLYEHGYPMPGSLVPIFTSIVSLIKGTNYLAFLDGVERPISVATMYDYPDLPILVLQGAATQEEYRGNGAYTALVAQRLMDGRSRALEIAILQADRRTSAPVCAKLGFEEVCSFDLWAWGVGEH